MRLAKVILGDIERLTGGYLYQKKLVAFLNEQGQDISIESLPDIPAPLGVALSPFIGFRLLRKGYDTLMIDEMTAPQTWTTGFLGVRKRPRVVVLIHMLKSANPYLGLSRLFWYPIERLLLMRADLVILNSYHTLQAVLRLGIERSKARVIYPGYELFGAPKQRKKKSGAPLRLLFVGTLEPHKGIHVLLEALHHLRSPIGLDILGKPPASFRYASRLQKAQAALGCDQEVHFHGEVARDRIGKFYEKADVLVMPSLYEAFGIVLLEAMALGLPAIASRTGGIPEIIGQETSGLLVSPEDPLALARAIERIDTEPGLLERLSLGALERIREFQPWEKGFEELLKLLKKP